MWDEAVHTIVASLPPVLRRPVVQKQRGSFLEGQLPGSASHVVKLSDGLNLFNLWKQNGQRNRLTQFALNLHCKSLRRTELQSWNKTNVCGRTKHKSQDLNDLWFVNEM